MPVNVAELRFTEPGMVFDRTGIYAYLHLIRGPDDPERSPRWSEQDPEKRMTQDEWLARKRRARNETRDWWRARITETLKTTKPATFNALMVTIADMTADVAPKAANDALWSLVADGTIVHTQERPVYFMLTEDTEPITDDVKPNSLALFLEPENP